MTYNSHYTRTITIDVLNEKALNLLRDLELLKLIRLHENANAEDLVSPTNIAKYKGAMKKQSLNEIDNQLNELRNAWE